MSREITAGKAVVSVEARARLAAGLAAAQKQLKTFAAGAGKIGGAAMLGASAVTAPIAGMAKQFADNGSLFDDIAQRTGATVESISGLGYAAKMSGAEIADIESAIRGMQKSVAGDDDALASMGLDAATIQAKSPEQQFLMFAQSISQIEDPAKRVSAAMKVFGKSGANLLPLLSTGAGGIEKLMAEGKALGATMSGEDAAAAAAFGDSIDNLGISFSGLVNTISAQVAPMFTTALVLVTGLISGARQWISANRGIVLAVTLAAVVLGLFGAGLVTAAGLAYGLSVAIGVVGATASAVSVILGAIASVFTGGIAAAIGVVVAALAGMAAYLIYSSGAGGKALDWLSSKFQMLSDIAGPVFEGIQNALKGGDFQLAAEIAWQGLQLAWLKGTADIRQTWDAWLNGLLGTLDSYINTFRKKWNDVSGWLADRMLEMYGMIDPTFDAVGAKQMRSEDTARQNKSFDAGVAARAADRDAAAKAAIESREKAIAELEAALATSTKKAAEVAAIADSKLSPDKEFEVPEIDFDREATPKAEKRTESATGTFSGFAAALMGATGAGFNVDQKLLEEARKQTEVLKSLDTKMVARDTTGSAAAKQNPTNTVEPQMLQSLVRSAGLLERILARLNELDGGAFA